MPVRSLAFDTADHLATFATSGRSVTSAAKVSGGTGYTVNDIIQVVGPARSTALLKVLTAPLGVIGTVSVESEGAYDVDPTNPVSVTGGTGSGATFNLTMGVAMVQSDVGGINFKDGIWYLSYWV
jgi:hypothetical protein